jgi:mono/diheme cytochrome c family protein
LALALTGLAMGLPGCQGRTDRAVAAGAGQGGAGRILYLTYCGSCHGGAGRGDGPAAGSLRTRPADLTRLFERYGSPLDRERVAEFVDGRALLAAHGSREMPIWGSEFFEDAPETTPNLEASKRRSIEVLVEYLETLQREQRT